jgi:hypothetical protein
VVAQSAGDSTTESWRGLRMIKKLAFIYKKKTVNKNENGVAISPPPLQIKHTMK